MTVVCSSLLFALCSVFSSLKVFLGIINKSHKTPSLNSLFRIVDVSLNIFNKEFKKVYKCKIIVNVTIAMRVLQSLCLLRQMAEICYQILSLP